MGWFGKLKSAGSKIVKVAAKAAKSPVIRAAIEAAVRARVKK